MADSILVLYAAEAPSETAGIRTILPTDDALQSAVEGAAQGAVLAIGGDAFTPPVSWRRWVRQLPRYRQGLGDAVRHALVQQGHPGAPLIAVDGAVENGRIVLVAPDDAAVRDAALGLLSELSGADRVSVPALDTESILAVAPAEMLLDDDSDAPGLSEPEPHAPARVSSVTTTAPAASHQTAKPSTHATIWQQALESLGWRLDHERWGQLPDALNRMAPVRQVLASAGERRLILSDDGKVRLACGFPDLRRADSKVLAISIEQDWQGRDVLEVLVLHRHPNPTGTCTEAGTWTPASNLMAGPLCEDRTGKASDAGGEIFAVEGRTVYLRRGSRVFAWDGRSEQAMGTTSQALASLVLRWSQM